jgi:hypothetical protein
MIVAFCLLELLEVARAKGSGCSLQPDWLSCKTDRCQHCTADEIRSQDIRETCIKDRAYPSGRSLRYQILSKAHVLSIWVVDPRIF